MDENKRKQNFNHMFLPLNRSSRMNIRENDIYIEWNLFNIEVNLWILKKMIFLLHVPSLKSKYMYKY